MEKYFFSEITLTNIDKFQCFFDQSLKGKVILGQMSHMLKVVQSQL